MKNKRGRPKKDIKQECWPTTGFTKSEFFIVSEKASKARLNLAAYLRMMAIHGEVKARFSEEQWQCVRDLVKMSNDLNRLARTANQEGMLKAIMHFETYRNRIDEILIRLKNVN